MAFGPLVLRVFTGTHPFGTILPEAKNPASLLGALQKQKDSGAKQVMPEKDLYQLVYVSRASSLMTSADLAKILVTARETNPTLGVTGILMYRRGDFLQVLEGPELAVDVLFRRIVKDPRHQEVEVVTRTPVARRQFADWSMALAEVTEPDLLGKEVLASLPPQPTIEGADEHTPTKYLLECFRRGLWSLAA